MPDPLFFDRLSRIVGTQNLLTDPANESVGQILEIVEKYGGPEEINRRAAEARDFKNLMARLKEINSPYTADIEWLTEQRDQGAFVSMADYYEKTQLSARSPILTTSAAGTANP